MKVIVLHGWGHSAQMWKVFTSKFHEYPIKAIDLPGFGDERLVSASWGIPDYANWVIAKLKKENQVILVGHSFGGRIAAEIASKNPKWLKGVVLISAPCLRRPSKSVQVKIALYKAVKRFIPNGLKHVFFHSELKEATDAGLKSVYIKTINHDQTDILRKVTAPSLLVWGENDLDAPLRIGEEMAKIIPKSTLEVIPHAGHNLHLTHTNILFGKINEYIKGI